MGYTHYWTRQQDTIPQDLWDKFVRKVTPIIEDHKSLLSDIEIGPERVFFNGGHETLVLARVEPPKDYLDGEHFSFCKTARKPYDKVVVACLILLTSITDGDPVSFSWSSDGEETDQAEGLALTGLSKIYWKSS